MVRTWPSTWLARITPRPSPSTIHGAQVLRIWKSTEPRLLWLVTERSEVMMIVAADVPIATWAYWALSPPSSGSISRSAGTTTKPPPIRSEERRVGKEWVRTGRSRWSPDHETKTTVKTQLAQERQEKI